MSQIGRAPADRGDTVNTSGWRAVAADFVPKWKRPPAGRAARSAFSTVLALVVGALTAVPPTAAAEPAVGIDWAAPAPDSSMPAIMNRLASTPDAVFVLGDTDGTLQGATSSGGRDVWVARYSQSGTLAWAKQFGSPGVDGSTDILATNAALYVSFHAGGHVVDDVITDHENIVIKLGHDGTELWRRHIPTAQNAHAYLGAGIDGGVVVTASKPAVTTFPMFGSALVRRYAANGAAVWDDTIVGTPLNAGSSGAWTTGIASDPGGVSVVGVRALDAAAVGKAFARRYSWVGTLLWEHVIQDPYNGTNPTFAGASSSAIWIGGTSVVPITGAENNFPAENYFVRRLGFDGSTAWTRDIPATRVDSDCSSFVVVGGIPIAGENWSGAFVERRAADGTVRWRFEEPGTPSTRTEFVDASVTGTDGYVIKDLWESSGTETRELVALAGIPSPGDCDTVNPTATAPTRKFVTGSAISSGRVTVRLGWSGSDATSGVARYEVAQSTDGGAWTTVSTSLTKPSIDRPLVTQHTYRFRVRAVDRAGNAGAWATGSTFTLSRYIESSSRIRYSGTWRSASSTTAYWGGIAKYASTAGARATFTSTGRTVAWVSRKGPTRGKAEIFVNGTKVATVDLYASSWQNQRVVWSTSWSNSATRTVSIRVVGTSGRPRVDLDAIVATD